MDTLSQLVVEALSRSKFDKQIESSQSKLNDGGWIR